MTADRELNEPHWEVNEDGKKSYHSGYFEKTCSRCQESFPVANHLAERIEHCPKCTLDIRHEDESNKDQATNKQPGD